MGSQYSSRAMITPPIAGVPAFNPPAGLYTSNQSVTITSLTGGASIYFTLNGSTPNLASTLYTGPIAVSTNETIKAIAVAPGFTQSGVGSASYVIQLPAATPTFAPVGGSYASSQSIV